MSNIKTSNIVAKVISTTEARCYYENVIVVQVLTDLPCNHASDVSICIKTIIKQLVAVVGGLFSPHSFYSAN
jgi:hypothetical protein